MAKFLITVWPLAGHYYPNLAVAEALRALGHEVRFFTGPSAEAAIRKEGFECFVFRRISKDKLDRILYVRSGSRWKWKQILEKRALYRDWLVGMLPEQIADISEVLEEWRPDVLVCDPMMWAPYLILRETRNIQVAIFAYVPFCTVPSPEAPPLGMGLAPPRDWMTRVQTKVASAVTRWLTAGIRHAADGVRRQHGLPPLRGTVSELAGEQDLYLVAGSPDFDFNRTNVPPSVHYVGPCLWSKPSTVPLPDWLRDLPFGQPVVHVTEGTVHATAPLVLSAAAKGLANLKMSVIMATGTHREPAELGLEPLAPNIRVERWVAYDQLLPKTDLVVTTAGAGTVLATLQAEIPMVVIPTEWDKPEVARRVAVAGAGVLLEPEHCTPERLRAAVERVLGDPTYRDNARRLAASFRRYRGPSEAAELLENLGAEASAASVRS